MRERTCHVPRDRCALFQVKICFSFGCSGEIAYLCRQKGTKKTWAITLKEYYQNASDRFIKEVRDVAYLLLKAL